MPDNVELLQGVYEAFAKGDVPTVLGSFDPKIEWNEAEHVTFWNGGAFIGPDAVVEGVFARIAPTFGDTFRIEPERFVACGDTVIMQGRYKGVSQATGNDLDVQVIHVWDVRDGKVVRFQQYTDTWAFERSTGQAPVT